MQIRPGGEKLSDTKVGEFARQALLLRLSAMQLMRQTLRPIITDAEIGSAIACRRWSGRSSCTEQKQEGEGKILPFQRRLVHFSCVVVRKWTNGYQCLEGKSPISPPGFPSWYHFLHTRQEMKFLSELYHLLSSSLPHHHRHCHPNPPHHPVIFAFLSGYPFERGRGRKLLSIFKREKLSVATT